MADRYISGPNADLIFVFAGRDYRKHYGLEFYRRGLAHSILFSVGRFEIRRFSSLPLPLPVNLLKYSSALPPHQRHFLVSINAEGVHVQHVVPQRLGSLMEVECLKRWLETRPEMQAILLVSSRSHLRRVKICCRALLAGRLQLHFASPPAALTGSLETSTIFSSFLEFIKKVGYWLLLKLCLHSATMGLRTHTRG